MKPIILACALLGLLSLDFEYDLDDLANTPAECEAEGNWWLDHYGCQDRPPETCAECTTDSECEALCKVPACTEEGQAGCWMPDNLNDPHTRTWWR